MRKILYILIALFLGSDLLVAQSANTALEQGQELNVLYRNEAVGGIIVHSRGFGLTYKRLKHVTGKRKRFIEFDLLNMRHPKEYKVHFGGKGAAKSFYYGKLNSVFVLRSGVGFQNVLYQRAERKSVEIRCSYSVGASIAFAKPVYLYVFHDNEKDPFIEQYDPSKHTLDNIAGRAPFINGFDRMSVHPGAYAKLGFSFEFADYSNEVKAIEIGAIVDAYPNAVAIMAYNPKEQAFVTLYATFVMGKKWF